MSVQQIGTLVLEALLGLFTAYAAYTLFAWTPPALTKAREALRYPRWYWLLAGVVAAIGAIGLLVGLVIPVVGAAAALWMVAYFVVATMTHVIRGDMRNVGTPILFLAIFAGLAYLRWSDMAPLLALLGH